VVQRVNVYPVIPATDLDCKIAPIPEVGIKDDVGFAMYHQPVLDAWFDCWTKLMKLHDFVATWPKSVP
jgi:hypothetical protein